MPTKENLPKHIKKGHELVFAQQDLTQREADLFALMIANMKPTDWDNNKTPEYRFSSTNLAQWLGITPKEVGKTLKPVADRLTKKNIGLPVENGNQEVEFDFISIFKRVKYKDRCLIMIPNDELKTAYIEYNQGYALVNSTSFFSLKREYAKRLYELLSRFKEKGTYLQDFDIHDLKGLFGLLDHTGKIKSGKKSFSSNSVFLERCIKSSIKDRTYALIAPTNFGNR